jgi:multidrug efflux pump subunit AcrA (membrane-fusion protein)
MVNVSGRIRSKRRIRWTGAGIVAVGVAAGVVLGVVHHRSGDEPAAGVVAVGVTKGEVTLDVATTGAVGPATTRELSFAAGGTVEAIQVRAGTRVKAGQVLATVDDTEAAGDLADAKANLGDAQERLGDAEGRAAAVTASATACAVPSTPARGHLTGVVPEPRAAAAACTTRGFPGTGDDPILDARQAVNRAGQAVTKAQAALNGTVITAPIAGTVVSVSGSVGDTVSSGKTFLTLADTYDMQVEAEFPEADAGSLAVGQTGTITLADHDEALAGTVVQVDPVGTSDGTLVRYGAVISFTTRPSDLLVGQSAQVRVRVGTVTDVLRVPSTAVHDISGGSGTVLLRQGSTGTRRTVTVGLRGDQYTQVVDGLAAGDQVVRSW